LAKRSHGSPLRQLTQRFGLASLDRFTLKPGSGLGLELQRPQGSEAKAGKVGGRKAEEEEEEREATQHGWRPLSPRCLHIAVTSRQANNP
jgi:hypothetical protein